MVRVRFNLHSPRGHQLSCLYQQLLHHTHHTRLELQVFLHGVTAIPQLLSIPTEDSSLPNPFSIGHFPGEKLTGNGGVQRDQVGWRIGVHCKWISSLQKVKIQHNKLGDFPNTKGYGGCLGSVNLLRSRACLTLTLQKSRLLCYFAG